MAAVFIPAEEGIKRLLIPGELTSGGLTSYHRKPAEGHASPPPFLIRTATSWGLGQISRKVSCVHRVQVRQVRQWVFREQESHPEWPGHTDTYNAKTAL